MRTIRRHPAILAGRYRGRMSLPVVLLLEPGFAEFRTLPNRLGRMGAIRVAETDLPALAARLAPTAGGSIEERLLAGLTALAARGEIKAQYLSNDDQVATHCRRAGIRYENRWFDTEQWRTTGRRVPLFRAAEPNGFLRTVSVELRTPQDGNDDFDVFLEEDFTDPAAGYPAVVHTRYSHDVHLGYAAMAAVSDRLGLPSEQSPDDRAEAVLTGLVARGELGPHLPPGGNRDRLVAWCAEAAVPARSGGMSRKHEILHDRDLVLSLHFRVDWRPAVVTFIEAYGGRDTEYSVSAPIAAVPVLAEHFERRLGSPPGAGRADDRLITCFGALAARNGGLTRQGYRGLVAEWMTEAGVTPTVTGFARTEKVLKEYRQGTDCVFELDLVMDATAPGDRGVIFSEKYEYLPRGGDAGRLYNYSVRTPYTSLPALAAHLEPGDGDLEERLARGFRRLVEAGELTGELELEVARDRVAALFVEAGVPAVTDSSAWFNSD